MGSRRVNRRAIRLQIVFVVALVTGVSSTRADEAYHPLRCEVIPEANHEVSFRIDGIEKLRWNFGGQYPRPFFYPFRGPSGAMLTRMGHPGAQNHDHHRSVWFAHAKVNGIDFWSDQTDSKIRQKLWYAYRDGNDEALMASALGWFAPDGREVVQHEVVAALRPARDGEHLFEFQLTLRPASGDSSVELEKTNFGLLAVRVAKSISVHFGGGRISDSEGRLGESDIFGQAARWMDYSGPVPVSAGATRSVAIEGITYFDHPQNPGFPSRWHVRDDGWMGASVCREQSRTLTPDRPLVLRYLLHAHRGSYDARRAAEVHEDFARRPGFTVDRSSAPHRQFEVRRASPADADSGRLE